MNPSRPHPRISLALKISFLTILLVASSIIVTGALTYLLEDRRQLKQEIGKRLLGIVRTAALSIDGDKHSEILRDDELGEEVLPVPNGPDIRLFGLEAFLEIRDYLEQVKEKNELQEDIYTFRLADRAEFTSAGFAMEFVVMTRNPEKPKIPYIGYRLSDLSLEQRHSIAYVFSRRKATFTDLYKDSEGMWISALAPIFDSEGTVEAVLEVDYNLSQFQMMMSRRLRKIVLYSLGGMLVALGLTLIVVRWLTEPIQILTAAMRRMARGESPQEVIIRSRDEIGFLAESFNHMLEGLRQRDFLSYALQRYVPATVVEQILENPDLIKLHGEKRELTVFFSDIEGFSALAEDRPPEEVVRLLNEYLEQLTDIIFDYKGTLDKYEGDTIMAFWGAPLPLEDHAIRACQCALDIKTRLQELRWEWRRTGKPLLPTRIGLNTGEMIVGNMGSRQHLDYTVVGDAVNLGARLESANREYGTQILLSEFTYRQVRDRMEAREIDRVLVWGKDQPITIYQLLGGKGSLSAEQQRLLEYFHRGLSLYRERNWDGARKTFLQGLQLDPEDLPSRVFIARCDRYMESPPPDDWTGIHRFTSK